jgi:DNA-binding NtrC family response regulator
MALASMDLEMELIGNSEPLIALRERMHAYAPARDTPVLIRGERGTETEVVARELHAHSPRAQRPFIALTCSAIPDSAIERELFGDEPTVPGARRGAHALANGGTLFLNHVDALGPHAQAKLLRAIEHREADARILAATHRSLEDDIAAGRFRADLLHRLAVAHLVVPPLRVRGNDIVSIAEALLQRTAERLRRQVQGFTRATRDVLLGYDWPGNVHELADEIERALLRNDGDVIALDDLRKRMKRRA